MASCRETVGLGGGVEAMPKELMAGSPGAPPPGVSHLTNAELSIQYSSSGADRAFACLVALNVKIKIQQAYVH
jgi:hypothetical protein